MKTLTAIAATAVVTAALALPLFLWYLPHEGAFKTRVMSVPSRPAVSIERRIAVYDWLAKYWYVVLLGVIPTTFVVVVVGLSRDGKEKR
jgi:hypothetical protein